MSEDGVEHAMEGDRALVLDVPESSSRIRSLSSPPLSDGVGDFSGTAHDGPDEYHRVLADDTLESIAIRYDTTPNRIMALNKLYTRQVCPGQLLRVFPSGDAPPSYAVAMAASNSPVREGVLNNDVQVSKSPAHAADSASSSSSHLPVTVSTASASSPLPVTIDALFIMPTSRIRGHLVLTSRRLIFEPANDDSTVLRFGKSDFYVDIIWDNVLQLHRGRTAPTKQKFDLESTILKGTGTLPLSESYRKDDPLANQRVVLMCLKRSAASRTQVFVSSDHSYVIAFAVPSAEIDFTIGTCNKYIHPSAQSHIHTPVPFVLPSDTVSAPVITYTQVSHEPPPRVESHGPLAEVMRKLREPRASPSKTRRKSKSRGSAPPAPTAEAIRPPDNKMPIDVNMLLMDNSGFLKTEHLEFLVKLVPDLVKNYRWHLTFSTREDGYNLQTLFNNVQDEQYSFIICKDSRGGVFGGYLSEPIVPSGEFFGTGESFLFVLEPQSRRAAFPWTAANSYVAVATHQYLGMGGNVNERERRFGLFLDRDLSKGHSGPCETFRNSVLATSADFDLVAVEIWYVVCMI